jgi:hypothetical protein
MMLSDLGFQETMVAVSAHSTAREIGQAFADAVRQESSARRLWVSVHESTVSLWLLTSVLDVDAERALYPLVDATEQAAAGTMVRLHVLNPRFGDLSDICATVPPDAVEIPLRAART